jgi:hypothetical protein
MYLLVKKLKEIQKIKRVGMLVTEAAQNYIENCYDSEEDDAQFGHF